MATMTATGIFGMMSGTLASPTMTNSSGNHLQSSNVVNFGPMRLIRNHNLTSNSSRSRMNYRLVPVVRASADPNSPIDKFAEGVKSDASKNTKIFGDIMADKIGEAGDTLVGVGRDMGAETQEAIDAGNRTLEQVDEKAQDVGQEVRSSTQSTFDAATDTSDGQNLVDKARNAAGNVGNNLKQNFDQGTGAVRNSAEDVNQDTKKTVERMSS